LNVDEELIINADGSSEFEAAGLSLRSPASGSDQTVKVDSNPFLKDAHLSTNSIKKQYYQLSSNSNKKII
jgi:hypothetical protein